MTELLHGNKNKQGNPRSHFAEALHNPDEH